MSRAFFGTDGIRGKVGEFPITPDFVLKLGWAAGRVFAQDGHSNSVLIGKDTRISGYMLESALEAGLSAAGVNTQLLGPMPTPAIAYLTRTFRAQAGVVISASHNPYYDNGIKFFGPDGMKLPDEVEKQIEDELEQPMVTVEGPLIGKASRIKDADGRYIEFCKSSLPYKADFSGLRIVVDCAHGSTYHIAPHVFSELGATVITIGASPNGLNINEGVGATRPETLRQAVLDHSANLGIALDGDGDRLIMADHKGDIFDGDELLYILARSREATGGMHGPVIGTLMSNLGLEHALGKMGIRLLRAAVGDRYVMELMLKHDSVLGGESSGHIICLDRTTTGDGIISALQILAEIWRTGRTLRELREGMHKYPQRLINVRLQQRVDLSAYPAITDAVSEVESQLGDRGRVLLRPSGTEPLVRVMVEGSERNMVYPLAEQLADRVRSILGAE